jgi:hypothetical protein
MKAVLLRYAVNGRIEDVPDVGISRSEVTLVDVRVFMEMLTDGHAAGVCFGRTEAADERPVFLRHGKESFLRRIAFYSKFSH